MDSIIKKKEKRNNVGSTLVEMIVCFALLAIFISSAAMIIASVTNLYYQVKGETYARQVADILMEKIAAEIEGAKYNKEVPFGESGNPVVKYELNPQISQTEKISSVSLYDRTDTMVTIFGSKGELLIDYAPISRADYEREGTVWRFDEGVYNQYKITDLKFVPGDKMNQASSRYGVDLVAYGISSSTTYDRNIVIVFLTIESPKYGTYRTVRPVKMFYVPAEETATP